MLKKCLDAWWKVTTGAWWLANWTVYVKVISRNSSIFFNTAEKTWLVLMLQTCKIMTNRQRFKMTKAAGWGRILLGDTANKKWNEVLLSLDPSYAHASLKTVLALIITADTYLKKHVLKLTLCMVRPHWTNTILSCHRHPIFLITRPSVLSSIKSSEAQMYCLSI